jgi:hypothetical protein
MDFTLGETDDNFKSNTHFKGTVARDFRPLVFYRANPPGPLIYVLKCFRIRLQNPQDVHI